MEAQSAHEQHSHPVSPGADVADWHELRETQEQLCLALKSAQMGAWYIDLKTNKISASDEGTRITGETIDQEDIADVIRRNVHPDDLDEVNRVLTAAIKNHTPYAHDYRVVRPDGAVRWIMARGDLRYDQTGQPQSMSGVFTDITERKESEAMLAAEKHKFEAVFFNAPSGMAIFKGAEFIIEKVNSDFSGFFDGRELIGKRLLEALPELADQPFLKLLGKVFETGEPFTGREVLTRLARRGGAEIEDRYFDFTFSRILNAEGKPYGISDHSIEVTEKVLYRKNLEESKKRLQSAVQGLENERELREGFVAALSHDLRNPLAAAKGGVELLTRSKDDRAMFQKLTALIGNSIDRADHMIRDLLDANRIHGGQTLPLKIEKCELTPLVQATADELAALHGNQFVVRSTQQLIGYWDCSALRRMVENLAGNAVKYGSAGTPVTIQLNQESANQIAISIHNKGNPISVADQGLLFQAFQRTESAQRGGQKGWGIGLTLVQGLAEAHGGRTEVESSPEKGTTFRVHLPLDARTFLEQGSLS